MEVFEFVDVEGSESTVYSRGKLFRYRLLEYLRQNYYKIFFFGIYLIVMLLIVVGVLSGLLVHAVNYNQDFKYKPVIDLSTVTKSHNEYRTVIDFTSESHDENIPCGKINCKIYIQPCNQSDFEYRSIKIYSCCGCMDDYRLRRYEKDVNSGEVSIYVETDKYDVCDLSLPTLIALPELECLQGSWSNVRESESTCRLKFQILSNACAYKPDD